MENKETEKQENVVKTQEEIKQDMKEDNIELDLDKYGNLPITSGGSKPLFDKITKVRVKKAVLMTTKERKEDLDKKGNKLVYYPIYLNVTYDINGDESWENMSGAKLFVSDTKGDKKIWLGENSALGKLKAVLEKSNIEFDGSIGSIANAIKDKEVGILTNEQTVAGTKYQKNLIEVIY